MSTADAFHAWFADQGWVPFPFQERARLSYARCGSGTLHAATRVGKPLAAWGSSFMEALDRSG
ncbi:MAG: hypothetical protein KC983_10775, partial [Phycisphaerales bacterium]|nr:hypothetical protein [Phycisphaerales bacterium]